MAFSLDISAVSIPGAPSATSAVSSGLSDTSKSLVDKITSDPGALFSNPMVGSVNVMGASIDKVQSSLAGIASGPAEGTGAISAAQAQSYLSGQGLQDLRSSMGNFMVHTDRLSGLLQSQGISSPGLQQVMAIGTQMQTMMTLINGASGCLSALGGATGIFSQGTVDSSSSQIAGLADRINGGLATIGDITDTITSTSNLVKGIMDKDSQFLQNCVNQLQSAAVGMVMESLNSNPCMKFMFENISNKNPGGLLDVLGKPIVSQ